MSISGSGTGKSVLIQRLAYELQKAGELVFIFNLGDLDLWLPADRYDVTGIAPSHPHRLRWNPLQIGRRIDPDSHIDTVVEIISNAGGLGAKQREFLRLALKNLYWELGALTNDPASWRHPQLGKLYPDDMQALNKEHQRRGLSLLTGQPPALGELEDWEQQAIAVYRSQQASFLRLHYLIDTLQQNWGNSSIDSVEGLKHRIRILAHRSIDPAQWLRIDEEPVPLDAYRDRFPDGGVVIVEGDGFTHSYIKSVWFGLAVALLCQDAKMRSSISETEDPGARQRFTLILDDLDPRPRFSAIPYPERLFRMGDTRGDSLTLGPFMGLYREIRKYGGRVILERTDDTIPEDLKLNLAMSRTPYLPLVQFAKNELPLSNCLYISDIADALIDAQPKQELLTQLPWCSAKA